MFTGTATPGGIENGFAPLCLVFKLVEQTHGILQRSQRGSAMSHCGIHERITVSLCPHWQAIGNRTSTFIKQEYCQATETMPCSENYP